MKVRKPGDRLNGPKTQNNKSVIAISTGDNVVVGNKKKQDVKLPAKSDVEIRVAQMADELLAKRLEELKAESQKVVNKPGFAKASPNFTPLKDKAKGSDEEKKKAIEENSSVPEEDEV